MFIKNNLEHRGSNRQNIKNNEPRPKFTGSYKKRVYLLSYHFRKSEAQSGKWVLEGSQI